MLGSSIWVFMIDWWLESDQKWYIFHDRFLGSGQCQKLVVKNLDPGPASGNFVSIESVTFQDNQVLADRQTPSLFRCLVILHAGMHLLVE